MPFVFVVLRLCLLGTKINEPITGWRRAFLRPFLMFWSHILLHIGFNIWPAVTGVFAPFLLSQSTVSCYKEHVISMVIEGAGVFRAACEIEESMMSAAWSAAGFENIVKAYDCRATLVFNHVSYTDGIILGAYFLPCGLAKASVADIPFFGSFAKVRPYT